MDHPESVMLVVAALQQRGWQSPDTFGPDSPWNFRTWPSTDGTKPTSIVLYWGDEWAVTFAHPEEYAHRQRTLPSATVLRQLPTIEAYRWSDGDTEPLPPAFPHYDVPSAFFHDVHVALGARGDARPARTSEEISPYDDELNSFLIARGWSSARDWKTDCYMDQWQWHRDRGRHPWEPTEITCQGTEFMVQFEQDLREPFAPFYTDREALMNHIDLLERFHWEPRR